MNVHFRALREQAVPIGTCTHCGKQTSARWRCPGEGIQEGEAVNAQALPEPAPGR